jgi:hypothetical protein
MIHVSDLPAASARTCGVFGCGRDAEVGAHVQRLDEGTNGHWYILPTCKGHNNDRRAVFDVKARSLIVPASPGHAGCAVRRG